MQGHSGDPSCCSRSLGGQVWGGSVLFMSTLPSPPLAPSPQGRAVLELKGMDGVGIYWAGGWSDRCQRSGLPLMRHLSTPVMAASSLTELCRILFAVASPGGAFASIMAAHTPVWGCGVTQGAAVLSQLRLGLCLGDHRKPVCFLLPASGASIPELLGSRVQAPHSPPISPSGPPTSKRAWLPFVGPQAWGIRGPLLL